MKIYVKPEITVGAGVLGDCIAIEIGEGSTTDNWSKQRDSYPDRYDNGSTDKELWSTKW